MISTRSPGFLLSLLVCAGGCSGAVVVHEGDDGGPGGAAGGGGGRGGGGGQSGGGGAATDGGAADKGVSGDAPPSSSGPVPTPGTRLGGASLIPPGGAASGPFARVWRGTIRGGDLAKTMPQVADLNGDGKLDLVLTARKTLPTVWLGKGDGTFGSAGIEVDSGLASIANGWGVDTGDIDGDGKLDFAMGDHNNVIRTRAYRNLGAMKFAQSSTGLVAPGMNGFSGCALADFNGDGKLDFVAGSDQFAAAQLWMAFGDGTGGWKEASTSGLVVSVNNTGHMMAADLDGDGDLDLVAGSGRSVAGAGYQITATVLINGGGGTSWTATPYGPFAGESYSETEISVADVGGDGKPDLAAGGAILVNDGAGRFTSKGMTEAATFNHFGDMDGDGKMDLVVHDSTIGLDVWLGDGTGGGWKKADVGLPHGDTMGGEAMGIDVWDVDGNGRLDIVRTLQVGISDAGTNYVEVWAR